MAEYGLMFTEQAVYYPRTIFKIRTHEDILQIFSRAASNLKFESKVMHNRPIAVCFF